MLMLEAGELVIKLFDLAAADENVRFSPYCWRVKMVLAHKGLPFEADAWHFVEKERLAFSHYDKVPVLQDAETTVVDSWAIVRYLETAYPDKPVFLAEPQALLFFKNWVERCVHPLMLRCVVADIHGLLSSEDQGYFRQTREKMLGAPLEQVQADRVAHRAALIATLEPLRATLQGQAFVAGDSPSMADYLLFAAFQWCRCVSSFQLLPDDSAIYAWREQMLDLHAGVARAAQGYELSGANL